MEKVAALVPMRHHSVRVPQKNYRKLSGRPLFYWILEALQKSQTISEIWVDTDSPIIKRHINCDFQGVNIIHRPPHLVDGDIPMNKIIAHDIGFTKANTILQTHSTNPFLKPDTIDKAVKQYFDSDCDSLFSVTRLQTRLWARDSAPINHDPEILLKTQDLDPVYEENSNIYIFDRQSFKETGNRIGKNPTMFEIEKMESIDIDDESDYMMAEILGQKIEQGGVQPPY